MAEILFADCLKSSLDVDSIDKYFVIASNKTAEVLRKMHPEGTMQGGNRYLLSSLEGGAGTSFVYDIQKGVWGDFAKNQHSYGLVGYISASQRCTTAQSVKFLVEEGFLDQKEAKKALADKDGDPLILPIPEEKQSWEYVLEQDALRKDRGILKGVWPYYDLDGSLLGYKYRVDDRSSAKEVYTLTFRAQSGWAKKSWQRKLAPPYGLELLRKGPTPRVLFVEGEKAADAAREILGDRWKVLGFSGVAAAEDLWLPDEPFWEDADIVLWPDNDVAGREATRKIQLALERLKNQPKELRIVRVESIPGLPPKWDLADWHSECGVDVKVELQRAEKIDSFERICREWCFVTQQDQFHNLLDRSLVWSVSAFDRRYSRYGDKTGSPSKKFLSDIATLQVDDLEFVPGEKTLVSTPAGKTFLNEWYPSDVYAKARDIAENPTIDDDTIAENAKYFIAHLKRLAADQEVEPDRDVKTGEIIEETVGRELWDALAFYFSNLIRRPMDKQGWVPMMVSENNGTGKSYLLAMVEAILGGNRTAIVTVSQYIGQYHDWKDGILFYELGEAKQHESTQVYEELKKNHNHKPFSFNKSPDRMAGAQKLNIKTRGMKTQRDFMDGYITSNNLYPLALSNSGAQDGSDRRLLVCRCENILSERETVELFDEELKNNPEWVAAWLLRFKPKYRWNPSWAPITEHKRKMFQRDRERAEAKTDKYELGKYDDFFHYVEWARRDGIGGLGRKVTTADIIRSVCEGKSVRYPHNEARFEKILERAGFYKGPRVKMEGRTHTLYATEESMVDQDEKTWKKELSASLNDGSF